MADKMCCPGCGSYTSRVLTAYEDGAPCPHCGLSAQAAAEILTVRTRVAEDRLKARVEELVKELDSTKAKRDKLRRLLDGLLYAAEDAAKGLGEGDGGG